MQAYYDLASATCDVINDNYKRLTPSPLAYERTLWETSSPRAASAYMRWDRAQEEARDAVRAAEIAGMFVKRGYFGDDGRRDPSFRQLWAALMPIREIPDELSCVLTNAERLETIALTEVSRKSQAANPNISRIGIAHLGTIW